MKRILLIEDEADHAELIQRALRDAGDEFKVTCVRNLDTAREMLEQFVPDLALVDFRLPDGRGDEFVATAAGRFPVVLLTAFGSERSAVEAIKVGALDYVVKSPEMFGNVRHLLQRSLREWENIRERKRAESRLEVINNLLSTMGPDFVQNAQRLIELLAHELGAQMVFFAAARGKKLSAVVGWHVAQTLPVCGECGCRACRKILDYAAGHYQEVAADKQNPATERFVICPGEKHTFLGKIIRRQFELVGIICLFFDRPYQPSEGDRRMLSILAAALGAEENRKRTDDELRAMDGRYRQIIQTANEGIWVMDELDKFTFVNRRPAEMQGAPAPAMRGQGTVLLVEDEDIVRRPIGIYLRKLGYQVIEAANGNQALALWRDHRETIDLLYTDMVMPEGLTGLELAERLVMEKPALSIIISSGYSIEFSAHGMTTESGFIYLPKPCAPALIASTVRSCIEQKKAGAV